MRQVLMATMVTMFMVSAATGDEQQDALAAISAMQTYRSDTAIPKSEEAINGMYALSPAMVGVANRYQSLKGEMTQAQQDWCESQLAEAYGWQGGADTHCMDGCFIFADGDESRGWAVEAYQQSQWNDAKLHADTAHFCFLVGTTAFRTSLQDQERAWGHINALHNMMDELP